MKKFILAGLFLSGVIVFTGDAFAQSVELQLLAQVNDYPSIGYSSCWGYTAPDGREYALLGVQSGTSIVDITDAPSVTEVEFIPGATSLWRELKSYRHYAYVVNESSGGMQIIDLSDLPNSATLVGSYTGFQTSHNIYVDTANAILYAEGSGGSQSVRVLSLADPVNPVQLSTFGIECHDIFARDNIAYVSEGSSGSIGIYDVNNPSAPTLLQRLQIPSGGYVHNAWLSDDDIYMITTEETPGRTVKLWDISDLSSITMTDEYLSAPSFFAHNAYLKGDYAYIAHYDDGVRVVDVSDPFDIFEVGYYNTYIGFGLGCWAAYPFFDSGKIIASDVETGLWVLYFEGAIGANRLDPNPPTNLAAYSDYTTPTSMRLTWTDPTTLVDGTPIQPSEFSIEINRDGTIVGSAPGGSGEYTDNGLTDGQLYTYLVNARILANDSTSRSVSAEWIAGGSRIPQPPTELSVRGNEFNITIAWRHAASNIDGTPIDDIAGVRLYQDGILVQTFARQPSVAGQVDSADYVPSIPGYYSWSLTTIDNEVPENESGSSQTVFTPLSIPFSDQFVNSGPPDPVFWMNDDADVNERASIPPSSPYALNLNGHPDGGDLVDLRPIDLTGLDGAGVSVTYSYQPRGTGNRPETSDSLMVFFKNDLGSWIKVRSYEGIELEPFQVENIDIASEPNGGGTYFFSQFQVRVQSKGTADPVTIFDDWFVDDVSVSLPLSVDGGSQSLPRTYELAQNYPNPFNPSTTIRFDLPSAGRVRLDIYNLLGERIRTLVDEVLEAGFQKATWDGMNHAGAQVVSGVYFYRLEAEGYRSTRKMILMR